MKKIHLFFSLVVAFVATSCTEENEPMLDTLQSEVVVVETKNKRPHNTSEAIQAAMRGFKDFGFIHSRSFEDAEVEIFTGNTQQDTLMYIVNFSQGGFAVVNAEDNTLPSILGISESGQFSPSENLAAKEYLDMLGDVGRNDSISIGGGPIGGGLGPIDDKVDPRIWDDYPKVSSYLLSTPDWGQMYPYNIYCPQYVVDKGTTNHCPAGCVAVAIGEIYSYHRCPDYADGVKMDWDAMLDPKGITDYGYDCIAHLLSQIGKDVSMNYDKDESGSTDDNALKGLKKYGFDKAKKSSSYLDAVVSISKYGPIYVSSTSKTTDKGHAWVADGWKTITNLTDIPELGATDGKLVEYTDNYLHFNWGMFGLDNGYFWIDRDFKTHYNEYSRFCTYIIDIYK